MKTTRPGQSPGKKTNRKEIMFTREEIASIQYAQKYYAADMTTTIRILIRSSIIEILARQKAQGFPRLTPEMEELITRAGL